MATVATRRLTSQIAAAAAPATHGVIGRERRVLRVLDEDLDAGHGIVRAAPLHEVDDGLIDADGHNGPDRGPDGDGHGSRSLSPSEPVGGRSCD